MADLLVVAAPFLMLACLYCGWRGLSLAASWKPATATLWRGSYSELDQQEDFWIKPDYLTSQGWNPLQSEEMRTSDEVVLFEDADGNRHRAHVSRQVQQGWKPDSVYTIWYDPRDPSRATAYGPGGWLAGAAFSAGALAWIFMGGARLAGIA